MLYTNLKFDKQSEKFEKSQDFNSGAKVIIVECEDRFKSTEESILNNHTLYRILEGRLVFLVNPEEISILQRDIEENEDIILDFLDSRMISNEHPSSGIYFLRNSYIENNGGTTSRGRLTLYTKKKSGVLSHTVGDAHYLYEFIIDKDESGIATDIHARMIPGSLKMLSRSINVLLEEDNIITNPLQFADYKNKKSAIKSKYERDDLNIRSTTMKMLILSLNKTPFERIIQGEEISSLPTIGVVEFKDELAPYEYEITSCGPGLSIAIKNPKGSYLVFRVFFEKEICSEFEQIYKMVGVTQVSIKTYDVESTYVCNLEINQEFKEGDILDINLIEKLFKEWIDAFIKKELIK